MTARGLLDRSRLTSVLGAAVAILTGLPGVACTTYRDELVAGRTAFQANEHERALAILRALENDMSHLSSSERAQYAYLRGMTDYRVGYKADARHWLMVARALDDTNPGDVPNEWKPTMDQTLTELNNQIYGGGEVVNARPPRARVQ